jgi:hypothetical protein
MKRLVFIPHAGDGMHRDQAVFDALVPTPRLEDAPPLSTDELKAWLFPLPVQEMDSGAP